jgi:hypothetical protein
VPRTSEDTTDHDLTLVLTRAGWLVDRDEYLSMLTPGELVAADAAPALVQQAAEKLEEAQQAESLRHFLQPVPLVAEADASTTEPALASASKLASASLLTSASKPASAPFVAAAPAGTITPSFIATITYNRSGAAKYADAHTSSVSGSTNYNPNYHNFTPDGGDCANFTSQCMFLGGGYPMLGSRSSGFTAGWWYDNNAGFPYCSASWRGANTQRVYWNSKYTTDVSSINNLALGDYIYYDTDHDGAVEHAAIVDAIVSGKYYIAAHTGNHLRYYPWYLSTSYVTHFSHVKNSIVWPMQP